MFRLRRRKMRRTSKRFEHGSWPASMQPPPRSSSACWNCSKLKGVRYENATPNAYSLRQGSISTAGGLTTAA
jgi:hypothetical protein